MPSNSRPASASKRLLLYKSLVLILGTAILAIGFQYWQLSHKLKEYMMTKNEPSFSSKDLPYYKEIMDIIQPLQYSGFESLSREGVSLSINFAKNTWTLHNLHRFSPEGMIILDNNRSGLCGELASYTLSRLKPLLGNKFDISFAKVSESGFFFSPNSSHIVLVIQDLSTQEYYLIDPTFHKYGRKDDFHEYTFFALSNSITGLKEKEKDVTFQIDHGTPILIRNDLISFLNVTSNDGKFDKDNFIIVINANKRYKFSGRIIFAARKNNGALEIFENTWLEKQALSPGEIETLKKKILIWIKNISP